MGARDLRQGKDLIEALGLMARTDAPSPCPDWFRIPGLSK